MRIGQKLLFPISLLLASNIITGDTNNEDIYYYLLNVVIFLIISIILSKVKKQIPKTIISISLLIFSIPTLLDNDISNLTAFFIFLMAFWLSPKSIKTYIIYLAVYILTTIYKFNNTGAIPSQIIGYLAGISTFAIIYEHYIHRLKNNQYNADYSSMIDKDIINIMQLYFNGETWDEISSKLKLNITGKSVQRTFDNYWKKRHFKNREQFAHFVGEKGIIKQVDKTEITR